jgi:hypothetical protein
MAPDYVNHTSLLSVQEPDREGVKWATAQLSAAVSDASVHFEDQVAAGDKVVTRLVAHATHNRGELLGVAPTGRELTWIANFIHRIGGQDRRGVGREHGPLRTTEKAAPRARDTRAR